MKIFVKQNFEQKQKKQVKTKKITTQQHYNHTPKRKQPNSKPF